MQWVDEVSGVVAMRHCGTYRVTTAAVDNLQFKEPVYEGEILVMIGYVTYVGNTSMEVEIDSYVERGDGMRYLVNRAFSVMVAVDKDERPTRIPALLSTQKLRKDVMRQLCSAGICVKSEETPGFKHETCCQKLFESEIEKTVPGSFGSQKKYAGSSFPVKAPERMGKRNPRVAARNHAKHDFCASRSVLL